MKFTGSSEGIHTLISHLTRVLRPEIRHRTSGLSTKLFHPSLQQGRSSSYDIQRGDQRIL